MRDDRAFYGDYVACLNARRWDALDAFVCDRVVHNGRSMDRAAYAEMIASHVAAAPDLHFAVATLVVQGGTIAARLVIAATPRAAFLGLPATGASVSVAEHVFYRLDEGRIAEVWSLLDRAALEAG